MDQGGLVVWVPQSSQALEDAGDAQVVVAAAVDDKRRILAPLLMVNIFSQTFSYLFRFSNLSLQFQAFVTSPVFSLDNSIP